MRPGSVHKGELAVRCPYCGDSTNELKSHMRINLATGLYHCYRCQVGGILPTKVLLSLSEYEGKDFTIGKRPFILPGPGSERKSLLPRFHSQNGSDAFYMYSPSTEGYYQSGIYLRRGKKSRIYGDQGISWGTAPTSLRSSPTSVLRLVEGPYDTLKPEDVCLFGFFSPRRLIELKGHFFYLVPDGDAWIKPDLTQLLLNRVEYCLQNSLGLMGVIFLEKNSDPDESPREEIIPVRYFRRKLWKQRSSSSKARLALAKLIS